MGMDVYSRTNQGYFRASIWSWPSILELCVRANEANKLDLDMAKWEHNDGAGLDSSEDCVRLADALDKVIAEHGPGEKLISKKGCMAGDSLMNVLGFTTAYSTDVEHAKEFVSFLRACGDGFAIW
jgi:hypothetical protein